MSRRLDLLLVPESPTHEIPATAWQAMVDVGLFADDGTPADAEGLPSFARARLDRAGPTIYGNQQGGFSVRCPVTDEPVVSRLGGALAAWREGGAPTLACVCGEQHALEALRYRPPAAAGMNALVFADVDAYVLDNPARGHLARILGPFRLIPRRVS
ncbi:MAG: hypothetical protein KC912_05095 [Proteobacteria bacterium]|nr:hypothetical protein [Pseudomonadota bacterium]